MALKFSALSLLTGLLLSGCNQQAAIEICSAPDTQKVIGSLLMDQAGKLTVEKKYDYYDGSFVLTGSQIRAVLDQVQIAVDNVKGVKQEANSGKSVCSGLVKITVPTALLTQVDQTREIQHQSKIAQYAEQLHIGHNANVFSQEMEYSVQSVGHGKEPQVEFGEAPLVSLLDEITTSALIQTTLGGQDFQETHPVQDNQQLKQDVQSLKIEVEPVQPEAEKIKVSEQKPGLARPNQELPEVQQVQTELDQERVTQQQLLPHDTDTQPITTSFNCTKAKKPTEIAICNSRELAALDVENMLRYKKAKDIDAVATHDIWKQSIKSKYACGTDISCIKAAYNQSMSSYACVIADNESDCGVELVSE